MLKKLFTVQRHAYIKHTSETRTYLDGVLSGIVITLVVKTIVDTIQENRELDRAYKQQLDDENYDSNVTNMR